MPTKLTNQHVCTVCNKSFASKSSAQNHQKVVHDKVKAFKCMYCSFAASSKGNLKKHTCYVRRSESGSILYEDAVQKRLAQETKGVMKKCLAGVVDLVSDTEIIEIKLWSNYFKAIGQIMLYGLSFPDKQKRIHFYGNQPSKAIVDEIMKFGKNNNVLITYDLEANLDANLDVNSKTDEAKNDTS